MSDSSDPQTSRGGILRKQNSAPSGNRVTFARPVAAPDVELRRSVGRWSYSMSRPAQGPEMRNWGVLDPQQIWCVSPNSYYPKMFVLLRKADEVKLVPAAGRRKMTTAEMRSILSKMEARRRAALYSGEEQTLALLQMLRDTIRRHRAEEWNKIWSSSAERLEKLIASSGERDAQQRLCFSAPAALQMWADDDEWVPAAVSTTAQGQELTSCGKQDSQRRLCVSAPAVCETRFVLPGTVDDEEWIPAVVSTPAADQESIEEERSLPVLVIHPFTRQEAADSQHGPFDQDQSAEDQDDPREGSSSMKSSDGERKMSLLDEDWRWKRCLSEVDEGTRKSDGKKEESLFIKLFCQPYIIYDLHMIILSCRSPSNILRSLARISTLKCPRTRGH
nr:uncharacterized protein LOC129413630 isoform X1 [Misgurnus anguillicaudatus]